MSVYFTNYIDNDNDYKIKAVLWDGDYSLYRYLVKFESNFIGVLHDKGQRGKDSIKIWNDYENKWIDCRKGDYIMKKENNTFDVIDRKTLISKFQRT